MLLKAGICFYAGLRLAPSSQPTEPLPSALGSHYATSLPIGSVLLTTGRQP
jgi:hypothetical protein